MVYKFAFDTKNRNSRIAIAGFLIVAIALPLALLTLRQPTRTDTFAAQYDKGDVNGDNRINLDDAAEIRHTIQAQRYAKNADLNGDNKVDAKDVELFYTVLSM